MRVVKEGTGKNGTPYIIRYIESTDAHGAWEYINELSREKTFVRFQGEEVSLEKETELVEKWVQQVAERKAVSLVLEVDGRICGMSGATLKELTEKHVATMGLAVLPSVRGEGIGGVFFQAVIDEAIKNLPGLRILTLEVKGPNDVAQSLYNKLGFIEFGRLPNGSTHRGEYVDEIFMYKPVV